MMLSSSLQPTKSLPLLLVLLGVATVTESQVAVVEFSSGEYVTYEGTGIFGLIIRRSGDIDKDVVVDVTLRDVSAKGNSIVRHAHTIGNNDCLSSSVNLD